MVKQLKDFETNRNITPTDEELLSQVEALSNRENANDGYVTSKRNSLAARLERASKNS